MCTEVLNKSEDEWKAAFYINNSHFKPLIIFFSITNSSATFQAIINNIFQNVIAGEIMIVYLYDILIFTWTLEDYYKAVYRVLKVLV